MATAWEILTGNSTSPPGHTAWEYLNTQEGGGTGVILSDGLEIEMEECEFDFELSTAPYELSLDEKEFIVEIDDEEYELEVC